MQNNQTSPQPLPPSLWLPPLKARSPHIPGLGNWLVGGFVLIVLFLAAFPVCGCGGVQIRGAQTKALAQAKQIGLALKLFAQDHNGDYPRAGLQDMLGAEPKNSNAAYAVLFPAYATNEVLFGNKLSAYQTRQPDNVYDTPYTGRPVRTLEPGENVYSYVAGLTEKSDPLSPLVADGTDGTGHYTIEPKKRGGTWSGSRAVVVFLDNSATLANLEGSDRARYIPRAGTRPGAGKENLLDVSDLGPDVRLLDPAVDSR